MQCGVVADTGNTVTVNVQTFTSERESSPGGRILRNHQIGKRNVDLEGSKRKEAEVSYEIFQ